MLLASCSRLAWAHNRNALGASLATLGARNPPARIDDAYALVGVKGATAPLGEYQGGDLQGVIDLLPYLDDLGVRLFEELK